MEGQKQLPVPWAGMSQGFSSSGSHTGVGPGRGVGVIAWGRSRLEGEKPFGTAVDGGPAFSIMTPPPPTTYHQHAAAQPNISVTPHKPNRWPRPRQTETA